MPNNVTDFVLYDELFHTAAGERIAQRVDAFNGALTTTGQGGAPSIGGITLSARTIIGNFERHTMFKRIPNLIQERDPTVNTAVADSALEHLEHVGVKFNRRIGPVKGTYDQFRKIGLSSEALSVEMGRQAGDDIFQDYLNTALTAAVAALRNTTVATSNIFSNAAAGNKLSPAHLNRGKAKMGDRMATALLIMHSGAYFDLIDDNSGGGARLFETADVAVRDGVPATGGSPVLVTDSPALVDDPNNPAEWYVCGVMPGGISLSESEGRMFKQQEVLGEENIATRLQGEHAFNLDLMGFRWNDAAGGPNPGAAAAGLPTNWVNYASSHKDNLGYLVEAAAV